MVGKSPKGRSLVFAASAFGTLMSACLDRPICFDCTPETTNQFIVRVPTGGIDKIDLVFMIDNSSSMSDKQKLLRAAVPSLLSRFISPRCVDENQQPTGTHFTNGTCPSGAPEFPPIGDIHIAVVSSSLGAAGATRYCTRGDSTRNDDDRGWLLPKARPAANIKSWNDSGFLAWDPSGTKNTPAGSASQSDLQGDFENLVSSVGENGCGFEASLESWYRFLIDPEPPADVVIQNNVSTPTGRDDALLAQRDAFLRSDSLVAILMLTDENDCSARVGGQGFIVADGPPDLQTSHMWRSTSVCAQNPNDACCRPCQPEDKPPTGCSAIADDAACQKSGGKLDASEDPLNLRCFDQKRRFGIDLLEPTDKYVRGLTQPTVPNRAQTLVSNPLFAARKGKPARDPKLVYLAGIVGVPWQDIATPDSLTPNGGLHYLKPNQLRDQGRWDVILGDPKTRKPPSDPHMLESITPRSGAHPFVPQATIAPASAATPPTADIIAGHEQTSANDLEYACIFELETPAPCADPRTCDCPDAKTASDLSRPLCQPPSGGAPGTTQYFAKAYPGLRQLEVLRGLGDQGLVASICPKVTRSAHPEDDPGYGYNPAVDAIVDVLQPLLANHCLARPPAVDDQGHAACAILETPVAGDCDCQKPGRAPAGDDALSALRQNLKDESLCDTEGSPACKQVCACKIEEATDGAALSACRSNLDASLQAPGYCYVDPEKGLGDPTLVHNCPATQKRLLRFVGPDTPSNGAVAFMACMGKTLSTR